MLYPSIDEIMKKVDSVYSLVVAASRRARQLCQGETSKLTKVMSHKQVGIALEEIHNDSLVIEPGMDDDPVPPKVK